MKYILQRERNGVIEYLKLLYSEDYQFKFKVTADINEVSPVSRMQLDMVLKLLVYMGEYFEVKVVAE